MRLPSSPMLATPAAVFSILLIVTGAAKLASPHDVEKALVSLGLPRVPMIGAAIGVVEIVVGSLALFSSTALWAQGGLYLVFAIWVVMALRADVPLASCGCLGKADTPPSGAHVALNVIGAPVGFGAALGRPLELSLDIAGVAQVLVVAVGVFLSYVILTDAARLAGARSR